MIDHNEKLPVLCYTKIYAMEGMNNGKSVDF